MKYSTPLILASLAIMAAACGHKKDSDTATQAPPIEVAPVVVDSVTIYKTYPGTLQANASADIVARVSGQITGKNYKSGDIVQRGQVLFTIEKGPYADAVNKAEAALTTAQSQYEYATRHLTALEKAFKSEAVSEMEVEQARSDAREAEASIKSAKAALNDARTNLSHCTVTAPFTGRVSDNVLSVGNYVAGEGSPVTLCTIYDNTQLIAVFAVESVGMAEELISTLQGKGDNIPLKFGQQLTHSYKGEMHYAAPNVSASTGTMLMQVTVDNPYDELRPGMYVDVNLPVGTDSKALLVRDASLSTDQLGKYLYTVNDSNRVVYTPVKVGELANDTMRIITEGLSPDARYVTSAMLKVREGETINPIEPKK